MTTPKILWQTWKNKKDIPSELRPYVKKWKDIHPSYGYFLLDDDDLLAVIKDNFPQYVESYQNFSKNIERVDFARYALLYSHGGIYADLDTYPLKSLDKWVNENKIVLGCEPKEHSEGIYSRERVVCNALMISPPKSPFWLGLMEYIVKNYEPNYRPLDNTGPMVITKFLETSEGEKYEKDMVITDPCVFYPVLNDGKISKECDIKESYAKHVWQNTWVVPWYQDSMWFNKRYWFYTLLILFFILWFCLYYKNKMTV